MCRRACNHRKIRFFLLSLATRFVCDASPMQPTRTRPTPVVLSCHIWTNYLIIVFFLLPLLLLHFMCVFTDFISQLRHIVRCELMSCCSSTDSVHNLPYLILFSNKNFHCILFINTVILLGAYTNNNSESINGEKVELAIFPSCVRYFSFLLSLLSSCSMNFNWNDPIGKFYNVAVFFFLLFFLRFLSIYSFIPMDNSLSYVDQIPRGIIIFRPIWITTSIFMEQIEYKTDWQESKVTDIEWCDENITELKIYQQVCHRHHHSRKKHTQRNGKRMKEHIENTIWSASHMCCASIPVFICVCMKSYSFMEHDNMDYIYKIKYDACVSVSIRAAYQNYTYAHNVVFQLPSVHNSHIHSTHVQFSITTISPSSQLIHLCCVF